MREQEKHGRPDEVWVVKSGRKTRYYSHRSSLVVAYLKPKATIAYDRKYYGNESVYYFGSDMFDETDLGDKLREIADQVEEELPHTRCTRKERIARFLELLEAI